MMRSIKWIVIFFEVFEGVVIFYSIAGKFTFLTSRRYQVDLTFSFASLVVSLRFLPLDRLFYLFVPRFSCDPRYFLYFILHSFFISSGIKLISYRSNMPTK